MRFLISSLVSLLSLASLQTAQAAGTIGLTITSTNNQAFTPSCVNGLWQIPSAAFTIQTTVTNNGVTNTGNPSTANGSAMTVIKASFLANGQGAPVTASNAQNVATSQSASNIWMFTLEQNPNVSAQITLNPGTPCTANSAVPKVTVSFAVPNAVSAPGGNGVPAVSPAVAVSVANKVAAANNPAAATPTTATPSKVVPTTAKATTAAPTAAAVTLNCQVQIPANPFSAASLSTPWQLLNTATTGCLQVLGTATFANCNILNLDTGAISVYNPLLVAAGSKTLEPPTVPTLPTNYVAACWFGTNGMTTTLVGVPDANAGGVSSLVEGNCVNGGGNTFSIFGQYAACNAPAFFNAANQMIAAKKLVIPPLGVDLNGNTCPTVLDFGVVDQDQSDNTATTYLADANGNVAQNTPQNVAALKAKGTAVTVIDNGSDERLITVLNNAIGCKGWMVPDLADPTGQTLVTSYATNELQGRLTTPPLAMIPANDPMVVDGNANPDVNKLNAYRASANEARVCSVAQASTLTYCQNMFAIGAPKILGWFAQTLNAAAPDFAVGLSPTLAGVLALRFNAAVGAGNLNCAALMTAAAPAKTQSSGFQLQDVFTAAPTIPVSTADPTTTAVPVYSSPFDMMSFDSTGAMTLPLTLDPTTGQPVNGMTWEQALGIGEQDAVTSPDNTQTVNLDNGGATAAATPATTPTTSSSSSGFSSLYLGIGIGAGVFAGIILGSIVAWKLADTKSRHATATGNIIRETAMV